MEGMRFIESIRLDRILSFGPNEEAFGLEPLNVLIGPNASGKSNFIEALSVSACCPAGPCKHLSEKVEVYGNGCGRGKQEGFGLDEN